MEIPPALLQFLGSLAAILLLAGLAYWLKLGPPPKLESEEQARLAASQVDDGFEPVAVSLDREGRGALLRDQSGRVMLLRPHGSHFAGRILGPLAAIRLDGTSLHIDTRERRFGTFVLTLDDASAWVQPERAIERAEHA